MSEDFVSILRMEPGEEDQVCQLVLQHISLLFVSREKQHQGNG